MTPSQICQQTPKYGSRYHLLRYRDNAAALLDEAIIQSITPKPPKHSLQWIYPLQNETRPEPTGTSFLALDPDQRRAWEDFWPQTGTAQSWDGIACYHGPTGQSWVLIEAKANHPEFCSPPSGAASGSLAQINRSLGQAKAALGVHRFFPWHGTYYQYANRLSFLFFLKKIGIQGHLVFLYFYGDQFPDGTPCPDSPGRWMELIHACHLTLGLTNGHMLQSWIHDVFLPVPVPAYCPSTSALSK